MNYCSAIYLHGLCFSHISVLYFNQYEPITSSRVSRYDSISLA